MIGLSGLRTFVAVVEAGGIRAASDRLGRTPSAISMALKQLEETIGGPLFQGDRKGHINELGRRVLDEARGLLSHHARASSALKAFAQNHVGRCDIASVPSVATTLLPDAILNVRRQGFIFDIHVRDIDSGSIIDAVESGAVEIGLCVFASYRPGLVFEALFEEPLDFVCLADHPLARRGTPIEWVDISAHPMIMNGSFASLKLPEVLKISENANVHARNVSSNFAMVLAGLGSTVLPRMCRWNCDNNIRFLPLADIRAVRTMGCLAKKDRQIQPATAYLMQCIRDLITEKSSLFGYNLID